MEPIAKRPVGRPRKTPKVDALTQALRRLYPLFNKLKISQAAINKAMGR